MIDVIILTIVIAVLLVGHILYVKDSNKQIMKLTEALMARSLAEYSTYSKPQEKVESIVDEESDLIPMDGMDDDQFNKMIERQVEGGK